MGGRAGGQGSRKGSGKGGRGVEKISRKKIERKREISPLVFCLFDRWRWDFNLFYFKDVNIFLACLAEAWLSLMR